EGARVDPEDLAAAVAPTTVIDARGIGAPEPLRRGRVRLFQRFVGQWVRTTRPVFDTTTVTLMDFEPGAETRFLYVLPVAAHRAPPALVAGLPVPSTVDPLRTRMLDAIFLRFLRDQPQRAPGVFLRMFGSLPGPLTVRFLTERSSPLDDLRLILALPKVPF